MTKRDIAELKKRLNKSECTITRMCGCYVDANKNKIVDISETFLNLEEEEFYKYLEIARKVLSGTIGNNLLQLDYSPQEEEPGGKQQALMAIRESALKSPALLQAFYDQIIEQYAYAGNYLILLFHDIYDVPTKTEDGKKIDESEEVYEYILCAICPVTLSKPGLGYRQEENRIASRIRDWVVGAPDVGFLFPAFDDRSANIHALTYYVKDAKDSHPDFIEEALGCGSKRTAKEQQQVFHSIIKRALGGENEDSEALLLDIEEGLQDYVEEAEVFTEGILEEDEAKLLTEDYLQSAMEQAGIDTLTQTKIKEDVADVFPEPPAMKNLIDEKSVEKNRKEKEEAKLRIQVQDLQRQLVQKSFDDLSEDEPGASNIYDVILRVKPEKSSQISSQHINGQKCLIIPLDENEHINLNGVNTQV